MRLRKFLEVKTIIRLSPREKQEKLEGVTLEIQKCAKGR